MMKLVYGPDPIFQEKSDEVGSITKEIVEICETLEALLYSEGAIGVAAPMVGVKKRIISYDLQENEDKKPITLINPVVIRTSEEFQIFEEGSICFPGVTIKVERPKTIKVKFIDIQGVEKEIEADGWIATVIQHEIDYLDGKIIFDQLSPIKKKMVYKKTKKYQKEMGL